MIESLTGIHADWTVGIVRILLGVIFSAHGAQKLLGWYGAGLAKSMRAFAEDLHLPRTLAFLVIVGEFLGWSRTDHRTVQQNPRACHRSHDSRRDCNCPFPIRPLFELVWRQGRARD